MTQVVLQEDAEFLQKVMAEYKAVLRTVMYDQTGYPFEGYYVPHLADLAGVFPNNQFEVVKLALIMNRYKIFARWDMMHCYFPVKEVW